MSKRVDLTKAKCRNDRNVGFIEIKSSQIWKDWKQRIEIKALDETTLGSEIDCQNRAEIDGDVFEKSFVDILNIESEHKTITTQINPIWDSKCWHLSIWNAKEQE